MIKNCMKRHVISVQALATIREAAAIMTKNHVGSLPVVDLNGKVIGMIGLSDMLSLEMPAFMKLISDLDFVSDFGAVETTRPTAEQVDRPVTTLMQPVRSISEESGLLLAYGLMVKHGLSDLPVIAKSGQLVGIVSQADIGSAILSTWKEIEGP